MFKIYIALISLSVSTLSSAIQFNAPPPPDFSSINQLYSQGNQQMQQGLQQMADAFSNSDSQETNYNRVGDHSYGSDGSSYYHNNGNTYGSNGVNTYQINENSGYSSNGERYQRVGNYVYFYDGNGNRRACYESDTGTMCR